MNREQQSLETFLFLNTIPFFVRFFSGILLIKESISEDLTALQSDCKSLRYYCYIFVIVTLITCLFEVILFIQASFKATENLRSLYNLLNLIYGVISFFLFIFMFFALFKNEPCGDFRNMVIFILALIIAFNIFWITCPSPDEKETIQ